MEALWQDLRYGFRMLRQSPGFTAVAVLTLALGIGANTAVFTALHVVLLRSLPVQHPHQLVFLSDPERHGMSVGSETENRTLFAYHEFEALRDHQQVFSGLCAASSWLSAQGVAIEGVSPSREAEPARISLVSGDYFRVLGIHAALGRTFTAEVDQGRGAHPVAVISYGFWKSRFACDPTVLGRKIRIRQTALDIIGVTPAGFFGETVGRSPDLWVPLTTQAEVHPGWGDYLARPKDIRLKVMWLQVIARLKPGVTLPQAQASVNVTFQQMLQSEAGDPMPADRRPEYLNQWITLADGRRGASTVRDAFGEPLRILMGLVGLVLLIACANVANLLLARAPTRQREIAVRVALGAGRRRLMRQLLTESVLLALFGGGLGLLLAPWADALLVRLVSEGPTPIPLDLHPDARVLGFTMGVSLLTGILFGLVPALRAARVNLNRALKSATQGAPRDGAPVGRVSAGKILVVGQMALSLLLLIVAGLFVRSFQKLTHMNPGYDRDHLLLVGISPEPGDYPGPALKQLDKRLLERIRAIPGVSGATLSSRGLFRWGEVNLTIAIEGYTPRPSQEMSAVFDFVGPNYFSTLGMPVLMGREIGPSDEGGGPRVGVINRTMARTYFGDASPIGRRIRADRDHPFDIIVVGVVADAQYNNLREQAPSQCYLPYFHPQSEAPHATFEIRVAGPAASVASAVRAAIKETAPSLPAPEVHTMNELVDESLTTERMITVLTSSFGLLALLLACIGVYGLVSYAAAGRTHEIGIRMALGAQSQDVLKLVVGEGMILTFVGIGVGVAAACGLTRFLASLLYGVTPTDPATFVVISLLLAAVALLASYIPARKAMKVDPMVALRYE